MIDAGCSVVGAVVEGHAQCEAATVMTPPVYGCRQSCRHRGAPLPVAGGGKQRGITRGLEAASLLEYGTTLLACRGSAAEHIGNVHWAYFKVGQLAGLPMLFAKVRARWRRFTKRSSLHKKGLRSTGGPDLLKWGLPGGGAKSAKSRADPLCLGPPGGVGAPHLP